MKKMLTVLSLCMTFAMGQTITSIAEIQFVASGAASDSSLLKGTDVTISGVVTGEPWGVDEGDNDHMFVQDADTAWSGIEIYTWDLLDHITFDAGVGRTVIVEGDSVTVTGTVDEFHNLTELVDVTALVVHGKATSPPAPIMVSTLEAGAEKYEGLLLKFDDVTVADPAVNDFGEWSITDGSGDLWVADDADLWSYYYWPTAGAELDAIAGILTYSFGAYLLSPRLARDIVQAGAYTRVQRIQQVLGSALELLPDSLDYDTSYLDGDTISALAIVTVPDRELSGWDTTGGVLSGYSRFIWQDPHGGPWSSILSYFADATAFPELLVGDSIIITGYIEEYHGSGGVAQFTELFITEPVEIVGVGANVPARQILTTGELRHPRTAEQWENNMVRIEDATVIANDLANNQFSLDDGTGVILSDADPTNSMSGYDVYGNFVGGEFVRPPNGTTIASIDGYVYHSYGGWSDNDTYQIRAVYPADIVLGGGPPAITGFAVTASPFGLADAVTVSADIVDGSTVAGAVVTYRVNGGSWADVALTATDDVWSGAIPATNTEGALVEYFVMATDDGGDNQDAAESTTLPSDTSASLYGYHTRATGPTVHDVQTSPFSRGDSYYVGAVVTLRGFVTMDAEAGGTFAIQSEATAGYGIVAYDTSGYVPTRGDDVTVTGTITEYFGATIIEDIQMVTVNSSGNAEDPVIVTAAVILADPEAYEGNLVTLGESTVIALNSYDRTVNDGTADILIDDDFADSDANTVHDTLKVDEVLASVSGIWNWSFGSWKIQLRNLGDLGILVGIADAEGLPRQFSLSQNYPNPFNPTTTINYSLAQNAKHTLKIYNLRGALVETLVNDVRPAGRYSIVWNARNYASGMYFLRLDAENFHSTKKLILLK